MTPEGKAEALQAPLRTFRDAAQAVMDSTGTRKLKYIMLRKIANEVGETIASHVPCRKGCDQCCHLAVLITAHEADLIAQHTGKTPRVLPRDAEAIVDALHGAADRYYGVPCPFLVDHACSIYEARPMACRSHHSLADNSDACSTIGQDARQRTVPTLSFSNALQVASAIQFMDRAPGDIREFFP